MYAQLFDSLSIVVGGSACLVLSCALDDTKMYNVIILLLLVGGGQQCE